MSLSENKVFINGKLPERKDLRTAIMEERAALIKIDEDNAKLDEWLNRGKHK